MKIVPRYTTHLTGAAVCCQHSHPRALHGLVGLAVPRALLLAHTRGRTVMKWVRPHALPPLARLVEDEHGRCDRSHVRKVAQRKRLGLECRLQRREVNHQELPHLIEKNHDDIT